MRRLLGVEVPDDARGVLQDIHWAAGAFGYFPSYALGCLIAAQLWERLESELGPQDDALRRAEVEPIRAWLGEHVHRHGRRLDTEPLVSPGDGRRDRRRALPALRQRVAVTPTAHRNAGRGEPAPARGLSCTSSSPGCGPTPTRATLASATTRARSSRAASSSTRSPATGRCRRRTQHASGDEASSDWIGIGGGCIDAGCTVGDNTLIQTGTEQDVSSGSASYGAWWELIPGPSIAITNMTVQPGDHMHADISEVVAGAEPLEDHAAERDARADVHHDRPVRLDARDGGVDRGDAAAHRHQRRPGRAAQPDHRPVHGRQGQRRVAPGLQAAEKMLLTDSAGSVIGTPSDPERARATASAPAPGRPAASSRLARARARRAPRDRSRLYQVACDRVEEAHVDHRDAVDPGPRARPHAGGDRPARPGHDPGRCASARRSASASGACPTRPAATSSRPASTGSCSRGASAATSSTCRPSRASRSRWRAAVRPAAGPTP